MYGLLPFVTAGAFFLLGFLGMMWQASLADPNPTDFQKQFVHVCEWTMAGSFGYMFGRWTRAAPKNLEDGADSST